MMRDNKPEGFFYLDHRTVDSKNNIIMDVHVTPGNVSDSEPILNRIDRIEETFNIKPKYLGLDAGYSTNPIFKEYYYKKIKEGKTKHQAIVCIMRRTCNIIYGILKNDTEYIPPKQLMEQCQNSFRERKKLEEEKRKKKEERKKRDIANINSNC